MENTKELKQQENEVAKKPSRLRKTVKIEVKENEEISAPPAPSLKKPAIWGKISRFSIYALAFIFTNQPPRLIKL